MPELMPSAAGHAPAVLAFERANRACFAASVSDRGDAWFDAFAERFGAPPAEQEAGVCAFYLLLDEDGAVLGRFNLYDLEDGGADVGYRVAQHVAGRGVATAAVRELCRLAASRHGLRRLRAAVADTNPASRRVVVKAGFAAAGPAGPDALGGRTGTWYERDLASP
jgi:ribosomal-protein-alanine N-acetyltransferase